MPYIEESRRTELTNGTSLPINAGEMNFLFTKIIIEYMEVKGLSYQVINDIVGALEGAKVEFNRQIVADYEDKKIKINGGIYPEFLVIK